MIRLLRLRLPVGGISLFVVLWCLAAGFLVLVLLGLLYKLKREGRDMSLVEKPVPEGSTAFMGSAVYNINSRPKRSFKVPREKEPAWIHDSVGGGAANAALAYLLASCTQPVVAPIVSRGCQAESLVRWLKDTFEFVYPIRSAARTRWSNIRFNPADGKTYTETSDAPIDRKATLMALEPVLKASKRLVVASMRREHNLLLHEIVDRFPGEVCLLATMDQCQDRALAIELFARCRLVTLNAEELRTVSGVTFDVMKGMEVLINKGVRGLMSTDGTGGIWACVDGEWGNALAYNVGDHPPSTSGCGDAAAGTFLASRDRGDSVAHAVTMASAAGALLASAQERKGGWSELEEFAATTPTWLSSNSRRPLVRAKIVIAGAASVAMAALVRVVADFVLS